MKALPKRLVCSLVLLLSGLELTAATIVSNLPADTEFELTNAGGARNAQGFVTPEASYRLDSVTLVLSGLGGGTGFSLRLVADSGNNSPSSSVVAAFPAIQGGISGTVAPYTLVPISETVLPPNTPLWLVVQSSDTVHWYESSTTASGAGLLLSGARNTTGDWISTGDYFSVQIVGTVVPEPTTTVLMALGLPISMGMGLRLRRPGR